MDDLSLLDWFLLGVATSLTLLGALFLLLWRITLRAPQNSSPIVPVAKPESDVQKRLQQLEKQVKEQEAEIAALRRQVHALQETTLLS